MYRNNEKKYKLCKKWNTTGQTLKQVTEQADNKN